MSGSGSCWMALKISTGWEQTDCLSRTEEDAHHYPLSVKAVRNAILSNVQMKRVFAIWAFWLVYECCKQVIEHTFQIIRTRIRRSVCRNHKQAPLGFALYSSEWRLTAHKRLFTGIQSSKAVSDLCSNSIPTPYKPSILFSLSTEVRTKYFVDKFGSVVSHILPASWILVANTQQTSMDRESDVHLKDACWPICINMWTIKAVGWSHEWGLRNLIVWGFPLHHSVSWKTW